MTAEATHITSLLLAEEQRMLEEDRRAANWKRWGPYLPERQWGTVREDYSSDGSVWTYFPHDHARSRAYRWGEDGLLGFTDRQCRLCFALTLWNEKDSILKERLFGLSGVEGNHGEDVKECYYYLDSTPTHSYCKALYKYPQNEFPYAQLVDENRARGRGAPEFELSDTGIFDNNEYFDIFVEYAKASPNEILIQITAHNRSDHTAPLHILPTLWFRNTWSWGRSGEGYSEKPILSLLDVRKIHARHPELEPFTFAAGVTPPSVGPIPLFTENETNSSRLFGKENPSPYVKDAFHNYVIHNHTTAVDPGCTGTKAALHYRFEIAARDSVVLKFKLASSNDPHDVSVDSKFDTVFSQRRTEADEYFNKLLKADLSADERNVSRQAYAGLLWSKQFYYYSVREWQEGDPTQPTPNASRKGLRNEEWEHLYNRDIISVPDKWEYPWYAAWDLAFHMVAFARLDPSFAKQQLLLLLREWYMHPNGQIPAYEFELSNVNPPVHAWACWRVFKMSSSHEERDYNFLKRAFSKLLLNFTWWINRKDIQGKNLFAGGFLGLDNIGVFDRSAPLPKGGHLQQADATAWMAFYCGTMLAIALELATHDEVYEDLASKFFEHFIAISDAINHLGGTGLWDDVDGFYYDQLQIEGHGIPLRARSLVGIIPMLAVEVLTDDQLSKLPGFRKRLQWFLNHRPDLAKSINYSQKSGLHLLAIPSRERLERLLKYVLDESEFLSPYGIRSLSKIHSEKPYTITLDNVLYRIDYCPGDSNTDFFGGNSNWRGPVWFPINVLLIEALERYHHYYGDSFVVSCPSGSGKKLSLLEVAQLLTKRLSQILLKDEDGIRPCHGGETRYHNDPLWCELPLFFEYFHGDTGRGIGASHQTGWTALIAWCIERLHR